jgi:hypothetical protein
LFRRSLKAQQDGLSASVVQESNARIDGDAALASSVTAVEAVAAAGTASGLVKLEAASAPDGVAARFGVYLRVDTVSGYDAEAAEFLEILEGGGTRKTIIADNTVLMGTDGEIFGLFGGANGAFFDNARIANLTADNIAAGTITTTELDVENIQLGDTNITDGSVPYVTIVDSGAISSINYTFSVVTEETASKPIFDIQFRLVMQGSASSAANYFIYVRNAAGSEILFGNWSFAAGNLGPHYRTVNYVARLSDLYDYTAGYQFRIIKTGGGANALIELIAISKAYSAT